MERGFAMLSLDDEEKEVVQVQKGPDPVLRKRNYVWKFLEYDGTNLGRRVRNHLRMRIQMDVRRPLGRKKKVLVSSEICSYVGGVLREERMMAAFKDVLDECQLMDVGFLDFRHGRLKRRIVRMRLDDCGKQVEAIS
ncbi:hypothetical protein Golax_019295 [Gossypium laxum]|uniref:Uncharacterized protein n=1 Tax=Gossypium laxum TaxID=34288 RepID=A0A7J8Z5T7_9ROSI|nr:hypothetical protein [Gossypium laxum]